MGEAESRQGVYVSLPELISLQYQATGFTFLPRQPVHSLLSGRHGSRLRGRGLDFEELRQYRPGDDIRTMDWKATKRTGEPYVRVYTEERERPVLLLVDQRISMFFGSTLHMKSVTAAHAAALAAWRVVGSGDRVGALVFNDQVIEEIKPGRSKKTVMRILQQIVLKNNALSIDTETPPAGAMLNRALEKAVRLAGHDYLVCVISDFFGLSEKTLYHAKQLVQHNDLLLLPIYDPLAKQLPAKAKLTIGDGTRQLRLDTEEKRLQERYPDFLEGRLQKLAQSLSRFGVPILPLQTAEAVAPQVRKILGEQTSRKKRSFTGVKRGVR